MKVFGTEIDVIYNQILALILNVYAWFQSSFIATSNECISDEDVLQMKDPCISIPGPGGLDRLELIEIPSSSSLSSSSFLNNEGNGGIKATIGYNIPGMKPPFVQIPIKSSEFPPDCVLIRNQFFSVNYADVTIRWGLYESALRYVGWPICPGFDFAGKVEIAGSNSGFKAGDEVFGFTLFGAYSSSILVPARQIRKKPKILEMSSAAAVPAVSATALHAVHLAGGWPDIPRGSNKAVLIHSAAGGVGSKLIQICKIVGFSPIIAVVGRTNKRTACLRLGADAVINKSTEDLWKRAEYYSKQGYAAIFDANGVSTLQASYDHLSLNGKLITYGFHSNIPMGGEFLSPIEWIKMIGRLVYMPRFDALDMVLSSKAVCGFNLSFFAQETELIDLYMNQLLEWIEQGLITQEDVTIYDMKDVGKAHNFIQSGKSIGKIVLEVPSKGRTKRRTSKKNM